MFYVVTRGCTTDWISKKRGYESKNSCSAHKTKISQIQFTLLLHTSASKFLLRAPPVYYLVHPRLNFLFYIVLLRNKILVLFGWDLGAGNSKILSLSIPSCSAIESTKRQHGC